MHLADAPGYSVAAVAQERRICREVALTASVGQHKSRFILTFCALNSFDDANVPHGAVRKNRQRFLLCRTLMLSAGLVHAVKPDNHGPLLKPRLVDFR